MSNNPYRNLPSVDALMDSPDLRELAVGHELKVEAARNALSEARDQISAGEEAPSMQTLQSMAIQIAQRLTKPSLCNVINATGVMIHTNLGRAPLTHGGTVAVTGYSNLEFELPSGTRGSRRGHLEHLLCELSGADAALVVNNTAAAVLLLLTANARGKEVLISRSELVEIGGSFRVPEIMEASGAILREIGTTNRTYVKDYERAINPNTAAILKVHRSNFRVSGFTHEATTSELVALGKKAGIPFWFDMGSATFGPLPPDLPAECNVRDEIKAGIDVGCFSSDKLLGGPQAGILVGKQAAIDSLASHPMARALRVGKLTIKHLQDVLLAYRRGDASAVVLSGMLNASKGELEKRGKQLLDQLDARGVMGELVASKDPIGGGSHPDQTLPGVAIRLTPTSGLNRIAAQLRQASTPVVSVVREDAVHLHVRTVLPEQIEELAAVVAEILAPRS